MRDQKKPSLAATPVFKGGLSKEGRKGEIFSLYLVFYALFTIFASK
jgi:hypothetical protein